jgi:SAM-dependent methyltransferase
VADTGTPTDEGWRETTAQSWVAVDSGSHTQQRALVGALDMMAQLPALRRLKAWAADRLDPQPRELAVDVGCGTGEDAMALATMVLGGRAVGVDASAAMVEEARRRSEAVGSPATFVVAPAEELPFGDAEVDVLRCERTLQHVPDPRVAVAEMARVLRPGGRVAVIDTDWRSVTVWPGDPQVTSAVRDAWVASFANAAAGGQLADLLLSAGFVDLVLTADVLLARSPAGPDAPPIALMVAAARQAGTVPPDVLAAWTAELRAAARDRRCLCAVTVVAAAARRG